MQNRPETGLPAVYAEAAAFSYASDAAASRTPVPLEIFDPTFLHYHSSLELGLCESGDGICYVEDGEYPFSAGDAQIIFPYQRHISKNTGAKPSRWYWVNIDHEKLLRSGGFSDAHRIEQLLATRMGLCGIFKKSQYPEVVRLVRALVRGSWEDGADAPLRTELCAAYLYTLLLELARLSAGMPKLTLPINKKLLALSPALDMLHESVETGASVGTAAMAAACAMSETCFRRIFVEAVGLPPKQYALRCRIGKAERLLISGDAPVLEISGECGFADVSGFNRCFMQQNGLTPSQFRKKYKR